MTAVELSNVTYGYEGAPAVEDVSLSVEEGEFLGLVGPNGSGKTTLLKLIVGLLRPDSGTVTLFGEPAHDFSDGTRVGYVAQETTGTESGMPITVREVVSMGRYPHVGLGRFGEDDVERVEAALETVGVSHLVNRRLSTLSGGQRQRVFIARALAGDTDLLALDEPAVGIDAESREEFYELLGTLNDAGMTVLLVEHDIGVVTAFASTVACMNRRLFFHGDSLSFSESDALREAYGANQRLLDHTH
ncbi:zinc transport system ATP-binding protein [Halopelagius inordinatus]|uniref:Cobalamin import ATP-binding protein BtuD n=1 Tax=Halopelagius inordinatus TaxID=553467 RepID=A0A1I2S052_9EURY|nr:metal ABC transporter ATP-binding protein [Halopelagius inordinatus]SFG44247.1 zinc transport system ATP-binding protein [Halopelagius inordinatus]